ncbi:MAG: hypothetical protein ACUVTL_07595 [Thermoproteota archaeon]
MLLRAKLYVMFSIDRQKEILQNGNIKEYLQKELLSLEAGKDIIKFALHGFQGNVYILLSMFANTRYNYSVKNMVKIREALKQHKQARTMITQNRTLKVNWKLLNLPIQNALIYQKILNSK